MFNTHAHRTIHTCILTHIQHTHSLFLHVFNLCFFVVVDNNDDKNHAKNKSKSKPSNKQPSSSTTAPISSSATTTTNTTSADTRIIANSNNLKSKTNTSPNAPTATLSSSSL